MNKLQAALSNVQPPKVSLRELIGQTYQAQNVQASPVNTIQLPNLQPMVNAAGEYVKTRERQAVQINNQRLFENMTPEQLKDARQSGTLPFADDLYANRAMIRELGRNEALNVDAKIQQKLQAMDFPDAAAMNKTRSEMMKEAQNKMAEAYGIDPNSTYWNEGMRDNMVERNLSLMNAQTASTDKQLRNKSKIIVNGGIDALLRVPMANRSAAIMAHINKNEDEGLIRSPLEKQAAIEYAVSQLVSTKNGAADIKSLGEQKLNIFGAHTTVAAFLGNEKMANLTTQAERNVYDMDFKSKQKFEQEFNAVQYADVSTPEGYAQAQQSWQNLMNSNELMQPSQQTSEQKERLAKLWLNLKERNAQAAEQNKLKLKKQMQSDNRYRTIRQRVLERLSGKGVPLTLNSFEDTEQTGQYTDNDYAEFYNRYSQEIDQQNSTPEQKAFDKMRLGNIFKGIDKGGFGTHYKAEMAAVSGELEAVNFAAQAGQQEMPPTPNLDMYQSMYKQDPKLFMSTFGSDSKVAMEIAMTSSLGLDLRTYLKGQALNQKADPATKALRLQEWQAQMAKRGDGNIITALTQEQKDAYMNFYQGIGGLASNKAMEVITNNINANFVDLSKNTDYNGVVERSQLMLDPADPDSAKQGEEALSDYIKNDPKYKYMKPSSIFTQGDNIVIFNTQGVEFIPQSKLHDIAREYGYLGKQ